MNSKTILAIATFSCATLATARAQSPVSIPLDSANRMIQSYLGSVSNDVTDLKSLVFDADSIRALLSAQPQIKKLRLFFAHTLTYINNGGQGQSCGYQSGKLTIVIAGYDAEGNYRYYPAGRVPDTGIPCPASCPAAGESASDLLPN